MRLTAFQVENYKTIENSGRVEIDTNVSCLLGTNESGKSAVMQALWKSRNVAGVKYDELYDLPAERYTELRGKKARVAVTEFKLDENEADEFKRTFTALSQPTKIVYASTYDDAGTLNVEGLVAKPKQFSSVLGVVNAGLAYLSKAAAKAAESGANPSLFPPAEKALNDLKTAGEPDKSPEAVGSDKIGAAIKLLEAVQSDHADEALASAIAAITTFGAADDVAAERGKANTWIQDRLPQFIYFEDYGRLRTRLNLPDYLSRVATAPVDSDMRAITRTQQALFEWAKLDAEELRRLGAIQQQNEAIEAVQRRKDERSRILESASYALTGDWLDWWDQRIHHIHLTADGDELELRVSDNVNPWRIQFGERSRGFQWFFSFYLTFLVESAKAHRGSILLLDEPGLHLHPLAQLKLLSFFQKISAKNQIIYSTHSMFMIDPDHVDNVRTVYLAPKDPKDEKSRRYTKVSPTGEPEGDRETLLPMQGAGAYQLAQTLFLGKRTLIVEGISDYWMLNTLSNYVQSSDGGGLDKDTIMLWAGGTSHILPLASIMTAREQIGPNRVALLFDSDKPGVDKARKLVNTMVRGSDAVMLVGDILGSPRTHIEDVAEASELVSALADLGRNVNASQVPGASENNVAYLERVFEENGWGPLTTDEKAKIVLRLADSWRSGTVVPRPQTLERAKALFSEINERFRKLGA